MRAAQIMPLNLAPRGLRREFAARYVGISPTTFDQMVGDGRMPKPKVIGAARVWDRQALDMAFEQLPSVDGETATNEWDAVLT